MTTSQFTAEELGHLASGARALARIAQHDAGGQDPSIRETFQESERVYRALAEKCERLAREPEAPPVYQQP